MRTERRNGSWWIADVPPYDVDGETVTVCGPYKTRDEADADLAGLTRFYRDHPEYAGDAVPMSIPGTPQADAVQRSETTTRVIQRTLFG
jgi:hypothetical protein